MYLKVILTLLLLVASVIAVRAWRLSQPDAVGSVAGDIKPYGVWPHDRIGVDPVLEKRIARVSIDAQRLDTALIQFRQQAGINLVWNADELPVMSGEPIRMEFRDKSVIAALTELLSLGLHPPPVGTRDETVVIGSNAVVTRFYDVRGILPNVLSIAPTAAAPGSATFRWSSDEAERAYKLVGAVSGALRTANLSVDQFEDSIEYWNGVLIVRARPEAHREIIRFFETLRGVAGPNSQ